MCRDARPHIAVGCHHLDVPRRASRRDELDDAVVCRAPAAVAHVQPTALPRRRTVDLAPVEYDHGVAPGCLGVAPEAGDQRAHGGGTVAPPAVGPAADDVHPVHDQQGRSWLGGRPWYVAHAVIASLRVRDSSADPAIVASGLGDRADGVCEIDHPRAGAL